MLLRVAQRHADQAEGQAYDAPARNGGSRGPSSGRRHWSKHQHPDPFENAKARPIQAGVTDGLVGDAGLAQPHREGGEHQHVRQASGEAQQQQARVARMGIGGEAARQVLQGMGLVGSSDKAPLTFASSGRQPWRRMSTQSLRSDPRRAVAPRCSSPDGCLPPG